MGRFQKGHLNVLWVVVPASHSHPRNWNAGPRDVPSFAPRAVLTIKLMTWLLIWGHLADFSRSPHFLLLLHWCFLSTVSHLGTLSAWVFQSSSAQLADLHLQEVFALLDCLLDVLWCYFQLSGKDKAFELCKLVSSSEPISCGLRTTSVGSMVSAGPSDTAPNHLAWVLGHNQSSLSCW